MTAAPDDDIDALGLNLVFSAPPAVGADAGKKPKRRTKYDRRRERGRQAKLGKEREQEERPRGEDWRRGEPQQQPLTGQTKQEDAVQVGHAAGVAAALGDTIAGDPSATAGTGSRPRGPGGDGTATQPTPSPPGDDNGTRGNAARAERGLAAIPRPSSAVTVGAAAPSRKRRVSQKREEMWFLSRAKAAVALQTLWDSSVVRMCRWMSKFLILGRLDLLEKSCNAATTFVPSLRGDKTSHAAMLRPAMLLMLFIVAMAVVTSLATAAHPAICVLITRRCHLLCRCY